jgi:hypothetical protein
MFRFPFWPHEGALGGVGPKAQVARPANTPTLPLHPRHQIAAASLDKLLDRNPFPRPPTSIGVATIGVERLAVAIVGVFDAVWINHVHLPSKAICQFATNRHFRWTRRKSGLVASLANRQVMMNNIDKSYIYIPIHTCQSLAICHVLARNSVPRRGNCHGLATILASHAALLALGANTILAPSVGSISPVSWRRTIASLNILVSAPRMPRRFNSTARYIDPSVEPRSAIRID